METKPAIFGGLSALIAASVAFGGCALVNAESAPMPTPATAESTVAHEPTTPCAEEDSPGPCYWDADAMGNGIGRSFYVDADQVVHYKD